MVLFYNTMSFADVTLASAKTGCILQKLRQQEMFRMVNRYTKWYLHREEGI
jgi:hypothetical protein